MPPLSSRPLVLLAMLMIALALSGCDDGHEISVERTPVQIGDTALEVVVHEAATPGFTFLNLHDDEDTSVQAALDVVRRRGGRVVEVQHTGARNVTFSLGDTSYVFDPNRMFTDVGARATLDTLSGGSVGEQAVAATRAFADAVLDRLGLDDLSIIITLHNNTEQSYSTLSYVGDGPYVMDAKFVHVSDDHDPDDFFFVTDMDLYNTIREAGFNVVLQDNLRATDDGSLSVYAGRADIPYVNVEAQHGHLQQQAEMLDALVTMLQ